MFGKREMPTQSSALPVSATHIFPPPPTSSIKESRSSSSHSGSRGYNDPVCPFPEPSYSPAPSPDLDRRLRLLNLARLGLAALVVMAAAAVVGCEAHAIGFYKTSGLEGDGWEGVVPPMWPAGLDLRPAQALVVGGSVVLLAALVYVLVGVVPLPRRLNLLGLFFSTGLTIVGLAGAIFGVSYKAYRDHSDSDRDTIQSWTCTLVNGAKDANKLLPDGLSGINAPEGFRRVCMETRVGFSLLGALIGLEVCLLVTTAISAWVGIKVRRQERVALNAFGEKIPMGS